MWSLGATCDVDGRYKFDDFFKELILGKNEKHPVPPSVGKIECPIPTDHTVYDFMFEVRLKCFLFLFSCALFLLIL